MRSCLNNRVFGNWILFLLSCSMSNMFRFYGIWFNFRSLWHFQTKLFLEIPTWRSPSSPRLQLWQWNLCESGGMEHWKKIQNKWEKVKIRKKQRVKHKWKSNPKLKPKYQTLHNFELYRNICSFKFRSSSELWHLQSLPRRFACGYGTMRHFGTLGCCWAHRYDTWELDVIRQF